MFVEYSFVHANTQPGAYRLFKETEHNSRVGLHVYKISERECEGSDKFLINRKNDESKRIFNTFQQLFILVTT